MLDNNKYSEKRFPIQAAIFDIDQTLLNLFELHQASYAQTFETIFGIQANISDIAFSGKTTPNIFREVCAYWQLDKTFTEARLEQAMLYLTRLSQAKLKALGNGIAQYVLPGVFKLLSELQQRDVILGILSGNPPELGFLVLEATGLLPFFSSFTFGTEASSRPELARIALKKLKSTLKLELTPQQILIIGDSVLDVQAALEVGVISMAVATGFHSLDELARQRPHFIFPDLANTKNILMALENQLTTD